MSIASPLYKDPIDFIATGVVVLHISMTTILLIGEFFNVMDSKSKKTQIFLIILTSGLLIWQALTVWYFYLQGPILVEFMFSLLALLLSLMVVMGQTEILNAVLLSPASKRRVTHLRYVFIVLWCVASIVELLKIAYLGMDTPLHKLSYMGFFMCVVIYENFHCFFVSSTLYKLADTYSKISRYDKTVWESQKNAYNTLFKLILCTCASDWCAFVLWGLSFSSNGTEKFPSLLVISSYWGMFHIIFVVLIFIQLARVPLQKHIKHMDAVLLYVNEKGSKMTIDLPLPVHLGELDLDIHFPTILNDSESPN
ncbi:hypothetical protein BC833DRAFT_617452 [Globomyces pollinis-pini]|nr:hypothetical protein BC833DRAFT_617452 [Globomyces pollinis-pini]